MTDLTNMRMDELCERGEDCQRRIGKMCSEGRPPSMSIPVRPEHDDDVFISTTLIEMTRRLRKAEIEVANRTFLERDASKRAEQAEFALLACQAREGELRGIRDIANYFISFYSGVSYALKEIEDLCQKHLLLMRSVRNTTHYPADAIEQDISKDAGNETNESSKNDITKRTSEKKWELLKLELERLFQERFSTEKLSSLQDVNDAKSNSNHSIYMGIITITQSLMMLSGYVRHAMDSYTENINDLSSHSTGSKIMAVVEAAKRMVKSGQAGEACSEIRAYYDLDEAVRALEAKHDD